MDEPGSVWLLNKGVLVCRWLRGCGLQREQQMDGDVARTGAPCLPAAIRHTLMIMSHLLPGRQAASAALSSKTGSTTPIPFSRPSPETPVDRLCRNPFFHQFCTSLFPSPSFHLLHLWSSCRPFPALSSSSACFHLAFPLTSPHSSLPSMCTCNMFSCPGLMGSAISQSHTFLLLNCDDLNQLCHALLKTIVSLSSNYVQALGRSPLSSGTHNNKLQQPVNCGVSALINC